MFKFDEDPSTENDCVYRHPGDFYVREPEVEDDYQGEVYNDRSTNTEVNISMEERIQIYQDIKRSFLLNDLLEKLEGYEFRETPNSCALERMVDMFLKKKDCNIADNDTWSYVIDSYFIGNKNK